MVFRYKLLLQLRKDQKLQAANETLLQKEYIGWMLAECLAMVVHPNLATHGVYSVLF